MSSDVETGGPEVVFEFFQDEEAPLLLSWADANGNVYDLTGYTGTGYLLKTDNTVAISWALSFAASGDNIDATIAPAPLATCEPGTYTLKLKLNSGGEVYYLPDAGTIYVRVKEAL